MKTSLSTLAVSFVPLLSASALAAPYPYASSYSVYGLFDDINTEIAQANSSISGNILTSSSLEISGTVDTDTAEPGYNITGGSLSISGVLVSTNVFYGVDSFYQTINGTGNVSSSGVAFNSGTVCYGFSQGDCSAGMIDLAVDPLLFDGTGSWASGYATTEGLNLLGGVGGYTFSVTQPGIDGVDDPFSPAYSSAAGVIPVFGVDWGLYLGGNLTFTFQSNCLPGEDCTVPDTYPDPSAVPLPMSAWLFGSALSGLLYFRRQRG